MKGGTESRAFLAWFLENYYRLEDVEIYDSVCDGTGDKGIDGIYVSEQLRQIDVFQVTIIKTEKKTLGDARLKQLAGTIAQLSSKRTAQAALKSANDELSAIAERLELIKHIEDKYEVRGVFITNGTADASARDYVDAHPKIILFDGVRLLNEFVTIDKTDPIQSEMSFDISGVPTLQLPIGMDLQMVVAPVAAGELVTMEGIANGDLFAWNVRQYLGRKTSVNKSVAESIKAPLEHKYFPAFHNGITVLCKSLKANDDKITISGYAVVNGCQSISNLFEYRSKITKDLKILTKFIQVEHDSELAKKITDHTNNQNGITARDQKSNDPIQTRLQTEIHARYPEFHYRIKRGERPEWPKDSVIENEELARITLAFDLNKPESWSQNYKLFDDLHGEIFGRKEMNSDRAVFMYDTYKTIYGKLTLFEDQLYGGYTLTRWLILDLVREALLTDPLGRKLYSNPAEFMSEPKGRQRLQDCIGQIATQLVRLVNADVKRRQAAAFFDHKKALKSREYIMDMRQKMIPQYQIIIDSHNAIGFEQMWKAPTTKPPGQQRRA